MTKSFLTCVSSEDFVTTSNKKLVTESSQTVLNKHPAGHAVNQSTLSLSSEVRHGTGGKVADEAGGDNKVAVQVAVVEEEDANSARAA